MRALSGEWKDALGLVKFTDAEGVWVRLGNGVVVTVPEGVLEPVEYSPGTGCPASFPEECKDGRHDFPPEERPPPEQGPVWFERLSERERILLVLLALGALAFFPYTCAKPEDPSIRDQKVLQRHR